MQVAKKDICATVAYLIGTRWNILMNCYGEEENLLNELHKNKEATKSKLQKTEGGPMGY